MGARRYYVLSGLGSDAENRLFRRGGATHRIVERIFLVVLDHDLGGGLARRRGALPPRRHRRRRSFGRVLVARVVLPYQSDDLAGRLFEGIVDLGGIDLA